MSPVLLAFLCSSTAHSDVLDPCKGDARGGGKLLGLRLQTQRARDWGSLLCTTSVKTFSLCAVGFSHLLLFSGSVMSDPLQLRGLAARQVSLSFTISESLLKLISIEWVVPSNHFILCHPLLLPPSVFPSIRVFSNESALPIRWPKCWSFSFSTSPVNKYSVKVKVAQSGLTL